MSQEERMKFLLKFLGVFETIVQQVTPELRQLIEKFVLELEAKAKATKSPYDDIAVAILKGVLGF